MNLLIGGSNQREALLVLDDGTSIIGRSCGCEGEVMGEMRVVADAFGYQAALGDAGNEGAIVAFAYPQVGNFGINADASGHATPAGIVVHDLVCTPSNWRCEKSLPAYLCEKGIVGIEDVDVRAVIARARDRAGMWAAISTETLDAEVLLARLASAKGGGQDA